MHREQDLQELSPTLNNFYFKSEVQDLKVDFNNLCQSSDSSSLSSKDEDDEFPDLLVQIVDENMQILLEYDMGLLPKKSNSF